MSCRYVALRQCVRAWLSRHFSTTASPLWLSGTRPRLLIQPTIASKQHAYASTLVYPTVAEKKPRKKRAATTQDKTVTVLEKSSTSKSKRTISKTLTKSRDNAAGTSLEDESFATPKRRGRPRKTPAVAPVVVEAPVPRRKPGRPRKSPAVEEVPGKPNPSATPTNRKPAIRKTARKAPPRIAYLAKTDKHWDLESFERRVHDRHGRTDTGYYKGTRYEYLVAQVLKAYGFDLQRRGRSRDLGIDLIGQWNLPSEPRELKVLIQCKASKNAPRMIRELEGTIPNGPAGYKDNVLGILVSTEVATRGVLDAIQRSGIPIGFIQITSDGIAQQFTWNVAAEARLVGLTANLTYGSATAKLHDSTPLSGQLSLQWMGKPWTTLTADV